MLSENRTSTIRVAHGATEMEQLAMEISGVALWELGDYTLQINRGGYLQLMKPVLAARNMDLFAGDKVTAYLDRRSGALLFAPVDVECESAAPWRLTRRQ